jgi:phosphoserine phosphatase
MPAALVNVCVDPRLNHASIRTQVGERAEGVPATSVFITNEPAGNFGGSARSTIALLRRARQQITFAALLHHDDCAAAAAGLRLDLAQSAKALQDELKQAGFDVPVLTGTIDTESSTILWTDRPLKTNEVLTFRMPRMYGR